MDDQRQGDELIGASLATAARVIGIAERRLRAWNDRGLVYPTEWSKLGSRTIWTFSLEDLVQGRVVKQLEACGSTYATFVVLWKRCGRRLIRGRSRLCSGGLPATRSSSATQTAVGWATRSPLKVF